MISLKITKYAVEQVFGIHIFIFSNFAAVAIECLFATIIRSSVMSRIYRVSLMIYGSLHAELMGTKRNSRIHRYGTLILITLLFMYQD